MPTKFCTSCGAEYLPTAQQCADCGGRLEFVSAGAAPVTRPTAPRRVGVFLGSYRDACNLRDVLARRDIEGIVIEREDVEVAGFHPVEVDGDHRPGFHEVLVAAEDRSLADEVRERLGMPAEAVPEGQEFIDGGCPACGHTLPDEPGDHCPDCGLAFWTEEPDGSTPPDEDPGTAGAGWLPHL